MDIWRSLLKMKASGERKPDFERFRRSVMTNEPGPVTVGDIFADFCARPAGTDFARLVLTGEA